MTNAMLVTSISIKLPNNAGAPDSRLTLDQAVDRLYELQLLKKQIEAEEKELRLRTCAVLVALGMEQHCSASGHVGTVYSSQNTSWKSDVLSKLLTEEQAERARKITPYTSLRIS